LGTKYVYRSVPKILTLWLDLGQQVHDEQARFGKSRGRMAEAQMKMLDGKVRNPFVSRELESSGSGN
jgi:hypothetical protein